jgi:predicted phosphodiesterase
MRIQLVSDVHVEFHRDDGRAFVESLDPTNVDVLVLAGDIAVAEGIPGVLARFCNRYRKSTVVYVHGNHEFYGSDRKSVCAVTQRAERENDNLVWLDGSLAEIRGQRFLGAPLWFPRHPDESRLKRGMTDFSAIRDFESWVHAENARAITFFEEELAPGDIVVTHHLPSQKSVASRYVGHPLNPFFVSDLDELVLSRSPRFWFHGHTHTSARYQLGVTSVACNPFGYAGYDLNRDFVDKLLFEA